MIAEIYIVAIITSVACALPGVFLTLKKMSMMSDSITHTVLLGIVLAFFVTHSLNSPLLTVGAALMGVATVWLTESAHRTKLMSEESSIGLVFPLLFSLAVILISMYTGSVHLDRDAVFLGSLELAPFNRLIVGGVDLGPKAIYTMGVILAVNIALLAVFFKELKLSAFDGVFAALIGFSPVLIHYALMMMVSITAVGAFEAAGSLLVIALMIGAPATAKLITNGLGAMVAVSVAVSAFNAVLGVTSAIVFNVSAAGSIAVATGLTFGAVMVFAPEKGIIAVSLNNKRKRDLFYMVTVLYHLYNHRNQTDSHIESGMTTIGEHLKIKQGYQRKIINRLLSDKDIIIYRNSFTLTDKGVGVLKERAHKLFA